MKSLGVICILATLAMACGANAAPTIDNSIPLTGGGSGTTRADIVWMGQLSDTVGILAPGKSAMNKVQLFLERENVVLGSNLSLTDGGVVSAGTIVNSYIAHLNPVDPSIVWEGSGTIAFDEAVLGLIYAKTASNSGVDAASAAQLTASDISVGLGSDRYDSNVTNRKLENTQPTWRDVATSSVYLNLFANTGMDEVRIITQGAAVPAPGALLLASLGVGLVSRFRRRAA